VLLAIAGRLARAELGVKSRDAINRVCTRVRSFVYLPHLPHAPCPIPQYPILPTVQKISPFDSNLVAAW
jgi:hypothetical protein